MAFLRYFTLLGFLVCTVVSARAQAPEWFKTVAGATNCNILAMHTDADGNVYNTGEFQGSINFNPLNNPAININGSGASDLFVQKLYPNGDTAWVISFGGNFSSEIKGKTITSDTLGNTYVAGTVKSGSTTVNMGAGTNITPNSQEQGFVMKIDPTGTVVWSKYIAANTIADRLDIRSIDINEGTQKVLVVGAFYGSVDFDPFSAGVGELTVVSQPSSDGFIFSLDQSTGAYDWAGKIEGNNDEICKSVRALDNGHYLVLGNCGAAPDLDPNAGITTPTGFATSGTNAFLIKMQPSNIYLAYISLNSDGDAFINATDLEISPSDGAMYIGGDFYSFTPNSTIAAYNATNTTFPIVPAIQNGAGGYTSGFIAKMNASFNALEWVRNFSDNAYDCTLNDMSVSGDSVYATGNMQNTMDFDLTSGTQGVVTGTSSSFFETYLLNLASNGNFGYAKLIGGSGITNNMEGLSVEFTAGGKLLLAGNFTGNTDFNLDPAQSMLINNSSALHYYIAQYPTPSVVVNHPDTVSLMLLAQNIRDINGNTILDNPAAFALYTGTDIPWDFNNLSSMGDWYGIDVDGSNRVTSIELGDIASLLGITVDTNNVLPDGLFYGNRLGLLQSLNLARCGFSTAPAEPWYITSGPNATTPTSHPLNQLVLSANNFGDNGANTTALITRVAGNFPILASLYVSNAFSQNASLNYSDVVIPPAMPGFAEIKAVNVFLNDNRLRGTLEDIDVTYPNLQTGHFHSNELDNIASFANTNNIFDINISGNKLNSAADVVELLNNCPNVASFSAVQCLSPTANRIFDPSQLLFNGAPLARVELDNNGFINPQGVALDLGYFFNQLTSPAYTYISLAGNSFDTLEISGSGPYFVSILNLSANKFNQPLPIDLFSKLRDVEELLLNNNLFHGVLPTPSGANYQCFTDATTTRIDLSTNQLEGDLRLDWLLGWLTSASVLRDVYLDDNHFENVVPFDPNNTLPASVTMAVEFVTVNDNSLGFDDLEKVAASFKMLGSNNPNLGGQFQYTPLAASDLGGFPNPTSFVYSPQDTVGIGGTRHKEPGSTVIFEEEVPTTGLLGTTEYVWTRTDIANSTRELLSYHQIGGSSITFLNGVVSMTLPSVNSFSLVSFLAVTSNLSVPVAQHTHTLTNNEGLQFNDADSVYGGMFTEMWRYAIQAYNSNFPLLEIVSYPKRLIVGACYDNSGQVIQCQQAFVQFNGNFSIQKSGVILSEAEKQALRDEIGVVVVKRCPCGDLEMWEISDTTYQNYLLSNGKGTRNVATTTSSSPGLLSANSDYQLDDSTATPKPAPIATITGNPNSPNAVRVAIIDSGVDYDHPALQDHILAPIAHSTDSCALNEFGYNFVDTTALPYDDFRHGTRVAGVLAGEANTTNTMMLDATNNDIALLSFKYTDAYANGTLFNATCGMYMAIENGAKVINASWGYWGDECPALQDAIKYAAEKGALLVCAAGNHTHDNITFSPDTMVHWPSAYGYTERLDTNFNLPNIITVAAIDENNPEVLASYSNFGFDLVHLATEGTVITTTIDTVGNVNETATDEGTSFAAPKVSRAVALLWAEFPAASFCEIKEALRWGIDTLQSADANKLAWKGRLNYSKARQVLADSLGLFAACQISSTPNTPNAATTTLVVSPNPFGSYINLQWIDNSNYNTAADIRVFSTDGRLRYQANTANNFETISTAEWQAGLYILQVKRNGKIYTEKIVKY